MLSLNREAGRAQHVAGVFLPAGVSPGGFAQVANLPEIIDSPGLGQCFLSAAEQSYFAGRHDGTPHDRWRV
jgi:hypothetical protein